MQKKKFNTSAITLTDDEKYSEEQLSGAIHPSKAYDHF